MIFKGIGISPGNVRGKLIKNHKIEALYPKEKIIVYVSNLNFEVVSNAIFNKDIIGIISERGGILSHGATLARELKLPCVIYRDQEGKLKNHDIIVIDGLKGLVEVL